MSVKISEKLLYMIQHSSSQRKYHENITIRVNFLSGLGDLSGGDLSTGDLSVGSPSVGDLSGELLSYWRSLSYCILLSY